MTAITLDGKALAQKKQGLLKEEVEQFQDKYQILPKLVVLLVGEDPASQVYVKNKEKAAQAIGFESVVERLSAEISQEELLQRIAFYNDDPKTHGILVQLPLPKHLDEQRILTAIDAKKDIDGFHPTNVGNFLLGNPSTKPCTPYGIMALLEEYGIDVTGKLALVIGRSNIVGKPMAQFLLKENATVIMAHSKTKNLKELTKQADVLVVAIGRGHFVTKDMVKEGAVVIDVGMNRSSQGKLIGDVAKDVAEVASYMTPVPGGVGPMTITMLMQQTLECAKRQVEAKA